MLSGKYESSLNRGVIVSKKHFKAAIIGGLIVFLWGVFAWMVLPWHKSSIRKFTNESSVAEAIRDNAPSSGIYQLPNTMSFHEGTSRKEMSRAMELMDKGPCMFAAVKLQGIGKMTAWPFVATLILQIIGAFIVVWMLMQTKALNFKKQVGFITVFGFAVGFLGTLPDWIWNGFPIGFVSMIIVDTVVGWFLAGLCIAKVLKK